ncbi:MAG: hypothetical protein NZ898_09985 [Myxococcota bacterium]|nr:hypothetical protein [Myxococcota bacterium]MDW8362236.1 hypothetical protein [Myxococcales bacterium]
MTSGACDRTGGVGGGDEAVVGSGVVGRGARGEATGVIAFRLDAAVAGAVRVAGREVRFATPVRPPPGRRPPGVVRLRPPPPLDLRAPMDDSTGGA